MWICPKCKEECEDTFDSCWNCGTGRDGLPGAEIFPEHNKSFQGTSNSLFSFSGRTNRGTFWVIVIAEFIIHLLLIVATIADRTGGAAVLRLIVAIPLVWILLATYTKRWHDLDMSAWMLLTLFIPLVNLLILLYLGLAPGTNGPNNYGEDPIQRPDADHSKG
jgi:uncharacterized membrane protein YhaH (DUF805 family)